MFLPDIQVSNQFIILNYPIIYCRITNYTQICMQKPHQTYPTLQNFITQTRKLLQREQQAQMEAFQDMTSNKSAVEIQDEGVGLTNMVVLGSKDGFYGKVILTFAKYHFSEKNRVTLPDHCKLGVGDDVAVFNGNTMIAEGVVYRRTPQKIRVSLIVDPEDDGNLDYLEDNRVSLNLILKWNEVTYRRYFSILDTLQNPRLDYPLTSLFFPQTARNYVPKKPEPFVSKKLNQKQNQAIQNGLVQSCHLIHGPPGTGKTTTVCQLIVEAVSRGQKVLACAPSNIAVDNIVQGISNRVNCVRVGNPARVINSIIERCLDFLIVNQQGQWKSQEKKLTAAQKKMRRCKDRKQKKELYSQIKELRRQIQTMQQQVIQQILLDADVICCTNAGAGDKVFRKYLEKRVFDLVVIDECGQGLQVSCWIPLIKGKRAVLAGDHKQLPPTVKFQTQSLLSFTLFSRAMEQLKYLGSTMLQVQYRMNKIIMGWSNKEFYENRLVAHQSVEKHTLQQIYDGVDEDDSVILMIDTAGCQMGEEGGSMESKQNQGQADIIVSVYKKLLKYGVEAKNIAILTPYSKQVTLIKNLITQADVQMSQISTVDGIQGRQKECILISMVRSNPNHQIGFLKDWRRMNVAITRARRMLIVVGDSDSVTSDQKISNLVDWIGLHGSIQSAEEFRYDSNVRFGMGKVSDNKPVKKIEAEQINEEKQQKKKEKKVKKQKKQKGNAQDNKKVERPQKLLHTQEQVESCRDQYRKKLQNLKNVQIFHDLNAYQRKIIHEVAEQFGFEHVTSEDKKMITVKVAKTEEIQQEEQQVKNEKKNKNKKKKKDSQAKVQQTTKVPQNMKELIGNQSSEQEDQGKNENTKPVKILIEPLKNEQNEQPQITSKKGKKKKGGKQEKKQEQEDWEKLLDDFTADMPTKDQCFKCKKKITSVTSTQCKYCNLHFCRFDLLAQEHGCEDAAREYARKGGNIDRFLQEGSRKIKQKLKQQEDKRKRKQKGNEKEKR